MEIFLLNQVRGFTGLLDTYSGAAAAYSLRRLSSSYTGPLIRVRESGGNTEADIGYDANGNLDTTALLAHCGANSGYVVTWYDQSGNSRNATQATSTAQPLIVTSGVLKTNVNGKPAIEGRSGAWGWNLSRSSSMSIAKNVPKSITLYVGTSGNNNAGYAFDFQTVQNKKIALGNDATYLFARGHRTYTAGYQDWAQGVSATTPRVSGLYVHTVLSRFEDGELDLRTNGSLVSTAAYLTGAGNSQNVNLDFIKLMNGYFNGHEIIHFDNHSFSVAAIETAINSYWQIY